MKKNNLILINKIENITSNKIIQLIKKKLKIDKIGHCGTLDPYASGLLIICVGENTKIASKIINYPKKYVVIAIIGIKSITDDLDGKINFFETKKKYIPKNNLKQTFKKIQKNNHHKPHLFSSIKHNGKNLYKFARLDIKMKIKDKENKITKINLLNYNKNTITFIVTCKHGTYIRSIINDLSELIKKPICTSKIIRLSIAKYTILNSFKYKEIKKIKLH